MVNTRNIFFPDNVAELYKNAFSSFPEQAGEGDLFGEALAMTGGLQRISLNQLDLAKLQNRFDSKYVFHFRHLPEMIRGIADDYFILAVNGEAIQPYATIYYDTPADHFYLAHHNGKSNRIKIRKRIYMNTGTCFLEVKMKDNRGKMKKNRLLTENHDDSFTTEENEFIMNETGYRSGDLVVTMRNFFYRVTLVNRNLDERCTIDFNLCFNNNQSVEFLNHLVVAELKHENFKSTSGFGRALKIRQIYTRNFSKYCIGRAVLQPTLKKNGFKPTLLKIRNHYTIGEYE